MEKYLSEYKPYIFWTKNKTKIFQPLGAVATEYTQTIDLLIDDVRSIFLSTAVFYVINPDVYEGKETVTLTLSDPKERFKIIFNFEVEVGPERFKTFLKSARYYSNSFSDSVETREGAFVGSFTTSASLNIKKEGYAEDGALLLNVEILYNHAQSLYKSLKEQLGNEEHEAEGKTRVSGIIKVGGWTPNPAPPGLAIEAPS